jgi:hypothetical protein
MKRSFAGQFAIVILVLCLPVGVFAQIIESTTEFTYQGRLRDGGTAASGNYDFELLLFDSLSGGTQVGPTLTRSPVAVSAGVFTVTLDFGSQFPGADRFIEIHVRQTGGGAFTPLTPRQRVDRAPYAMTAANAAQLGGVAASQYVLTGDARLSDARNPLPGSASYIQNQTAAAQASDFKIGGNGVVGGLLSGNVVDAAIQYNIAGNRVLSNSGTSNFFAGVNAGKVNLTGIADSFFGESAGAHNTSGNDNSFFGVQAGFNSVGAANSFFGVQAGYGNQSGSSNTAVGDAADFGLGNLDHATAIGAGTIANASNMVQIGRSALDTVAIGAFAAATSTHVCITGQGVFASCSSSVRYKEDVRPFTRGLNLIARLRPVTFKWKDRDEHDLGLIAEEVAAVEPSLIFYNQKGEIEGVKYAQINAVLINAVNEQQAQLEAQHTQIGQQAKQIESLTKIVCAMSSQADICRQ